GFGHGGPVPGRLRHRSGRRPPGPGRRPLLRRRARGPGGRPRRSGDRDPAHDHRPARVAEDRRLAPVGSWSLSTGTCRGPHRRSGLYWLLFLIPVLGLGLFLFSGESWELGRGEWRAPWAWVDDDVLLAVHIAGHRAETPADRPGWATAPDVVTPRAR